MVAMGPSTGGMILAPGNVFQVSGRQLITLYLSHHALRGQLSNAILPGGCSVEAGVDIFAASPHALPFVASHRAPHGVLWGYFSAEKAAEHIQPAPGGCWVRYGTEKRYMINGEELGYRSRFAFHVTRVEDDRRVMWATTWWQMKEYRLNKGAPLFRKHPKANMDFVIRKVFNKPTVLIRKRASAAQPLKVQRVESPLPSPNVKDCVEPARQDSIAPVLSPPPPHASASQALKRGGTRLPPRAARPPRPPKPSKKPKVAPPPPAGPVVAPPPPASPTVAPRPPASPRVAPPPPAGQVVAPRPPAGPTLAHRPPARPTVAAPPPARPVVAPPPPAGPTLAHRPPARPSFARPPHAGPMIAPRPYARPTFAPRPPARPSFARPPPAGPMFAPRPPARPTFAPRPPACPSFPRPPPARSSSGAQPDTSKANTDIVICRVKTLAPPPAPNPDSNLPGVNNQAVARTSFPPNMFKVPSGLHAITYYLGPKAVHGRLPGHCYVAQGVDVFAAPPDALPFPYSCSLRDRRVWGAGYFFAAKPTTSTRRVPGGCWMQIQNGIEKRYQISEQIFACRRIFVFRAARGYGRVTWERTPWVMKEYQINKGVPCVRRLLRPESNMDLVVLKIFPNTKPRLRAIIAPPPPVRPFVAPPSPALPSWEVCFSGAQPMGNTEVCKIKKIKTMAPLPAPSPDSNHQEAASHNNQDAASTRIKGKIPSGVHVMMQYLMPKALLGRLPGGVNRPDYIAQDQRVFAISPDMLSFPAGNRGQHGSVWGYFSDSTPTPSMRPVAGGCWMRYDMEKRYELSGEIIGSRRRFVFHAAHSPRGDYDPATMTWKQTRWLMKEYRLNKVSPTMVRAARLLPQSNLDVVVLKVFTKPMPMGMALPPGPPLPPPPIPPYKASPPVPPPAPANMLEALPPRLTDEENLGSNHPSENEDSSGPNDEERATKRARGSSSGSPLILD